MNQPDTIDLNPPKRTFPQWIADHNPFFLISGVLMLVGCFLINRAAHDDPDVIWPVVGLVGVFNIYEFMVIGLASYLSRKRVYYRDAGFLFFLEILLLSDVALSYNELILKSLPIGLVVSALALGLALVKIVLIGRGLGLRITKTGAWMMPALIAMLFILPSVFRQLTWLEWLREGHFYAAWWVLAALPLVVVLTQPWFGRCSSRDPGLASLRKWTAWLLIVIPIGSLLLHLRTAHYVDDRMIHVYNYAPLVLGLVTAWIVRRSHTLPMELAATLAFLAGVVAVGMSISFPNTIVAPLLPRDYLVFSPLRLMMVVAALQMTYIGWWRGAWMCLLPAFVWLFAAGLGHSVSSIFRTLRNGLKWAWELVMNLVPHTTLGWGMVAVAASFVFLLIGATASLTSRPIRAEKATR